MKKQVKQPSKSVEKISETTACFKQYFDNVNRASRRKTKIIAALKKIAVAFSDRDLIQNRAKAIEDEIRSGKNAWFSSLNCKLFAQLLMETPNIEKQPKLKKIMPGAILLWGSGHGFAHVAVALDENTLIQVPGWHGAVEVVPLKKVVLEWGESYTLYKPAKTPKQIKQPSK